MQEETAHEKSICGAKTRSGGKCRKFPLENGRCRLHGGLSLHGPAHPSFKHGGRSKYMPKGVYTRYQEALADPEIVRSRQNLATIESRLRELFGQLDAKASGELWKSMQDAVQDMVSSAEAGDSDRLKAAMQEVVRISKRGFKDYHVWREICEQIDRQAKLEQHYLATLETQQQMLSSEQAMMLLNGVIEAVKRHVSDTGVLAHIAADFRRLMGGRVLETTVAASGPSNDGES